MSKSPQAERSEPVITPRTVDDVLDGAERAAADMRRTYLTENLTEVFSTAMDRGDRTEARRAVRKIKEPLPKATLALSLAVVSECDPNAGRIERALDRSRLSGALATLYNNESTKQSNVRRSNLAWDALHAVGAYGGYLDECERIGQLLEELSEVPLEAHRTV